MPWNGHYILVLPPRRHFQLASCPLFHRFPIQRHKRMRRGEEQVILPTILLLLNCDADGFPPHPCLLDASSLFNKCAKRGRSDAPKSPYKYILEEETVSFLFTANLSRWMKRKEGRKRDFMQWIEALRPHSLPSSLFLQQGGRGGGVVEREARGPASLRAATPRDVHTNHYRCEYGKKKDDM